MINSGESVGAGTANGNNTTQFSLMNQSASGFHKDMSFQMLIHDQQSSQNQLIDTDLSGIHASPSEINFAPTKQVEKARMPAQ